MSGGQRADEAAVVLDLESPNQARRYGYLVGGKDNFAVDRHSGDEILCLMPHVRTAAVENRRFVQRVARWLVREAGIVQVLDVGCGMPLDADANVHEVAQTIDPAVRVAYVDLDPVVGVHMRARATSHPEGAVTFVCGDLRDPRGFLADPLLHDTLDLTRPVGVLLCAVLHFVEDDDRAYAAVATLVDAVPPGSVVAVSHGSFDDNPADHDALKMLGRRHGPFRPRTRAQVERFLAGLALVEPGVVSVVDWHPELSPHPGASAAQAICYAAVGRRS